MLLQDSIGVSSLAGLLNMDFFQVSICSPVQNRFKELQKGGFWRVKIHQSVLYCFITLQTAVWKEIIRAIIADDQIGGASPCMTLSSSVSKWSSMSKLETVPQLDCREVLHLLC